MASTWNASLHVSGTNTVIVSVSIAIDIMIVVIVSMWNVACQYWSHPAVLSTLFKHMQIEHTVVNRHLQFT